MALEAMNFASNFTWMGNECCILFKITMVLVQMVFGIDVKYLYGCTYYCYHYKNPKDLLLDLTIIILVHNF